jgi:dihydroorotate dehydrogenase (NAD+) catalytic subunit
MHRYQPRDYAATINKKTETKKSGKGTSVFRMARLDVQVAGVKMRNPLVLASGVRGNYADLLIRAASEGAGAVTSKSCSIEPRPGHPNPTAMIHGQTLMNAVGLSNPGAKEEAEQLAKAVKEAGVPVIASVFGKNADEFVEAARTVEKAKPAMVELNISCPNVHKEGRMFSADPAATEEIVRAVKKAVKIPVSAKLSPNVTDIAEIAVAAKKGGADAITAINSVSGMWIDAYAKKPYLANRMGGLSGPAIKPVALRSVWQIRQVVDLPIIGGGGITTGTDAAEMLMAGATAVSIGSAVCYRKNAFADISGELVGFMESEGYSKVSDIKLV